MDDKTHILKILRKEGKAAANTPYKIPENYFERFSERLLKRTRDGIENINEGVLLKGISKEPVFQVPEGYFQELEKIITGKITGVPAARVFSLKKWYKIAAAAVVAVLVTWGTIEYSGRKDAAADASISIATVESLSSLELKDFAEEASKSSFYNENKKNIVDNDQLFMEISNQELHSFLNENTGSGSELF
ncbi:hypothetical protein [Niabella aquatica]